MIVSDIKLHHYRLPVKRLLRVGDVALDDRQGLILTIEAEGGCIGIGEVAPLPGYSPEALDEAVHQLRALRFRFKGAPVPEDIDELSGSFHRWLGAVCGSVRFGLESAVLSLAAEIKGSTLDGLLSASPLNSVPVNALLSGAGRDTAAAVREIVDAGFRTLKLKVGWRDLDEDIAAVELLRKIAGPDTKIRVDANQRFTVDQVSRFVDAVSGANIEYLEEPTPPDQFREVCEILRNRRFAVPLALDESLTGLMPEQLTDFPDLGAIILKPSLLGLERSMQFARMARARGVKVVISGMFESSVGISHLVRFAAAVIAPDTAAGLDTISWLDDDIVKPGVAAVGGSISLDSLPSLQRDLQWHKLVEVDTG